MELTTNAVVLVTGASGMVGKAVCSLLSQRGVIQILKPTRQELDLLNKARVDEYFQTYRPTHVLMLAAKVGGIAANRADPVGFLAENVTMETNVFESCHRYKVAKSLFLGSSCIYPRDCPQPMKEDYLLTGPLEPTNEGYALAKIVGLKLAQYYFEQYGMITVCPMPCNIYGTNDHYDLHRSHVLSALVRRFVDAKDDSLCQVTLWGSGTARREFIHVYDIANALLFMMDNVNSPGIMNVGTGVDISVFDLAHLIAKMVGYEGDLLWDLSKPDGMPRKCLDITKMKELGFTPKIGLEEGIKRTIGEYTHLKKSNQT